MITDAEKQAGHCGTCKHWGANDGLELDVRECARIRGSIADGLVWLEVGDPYEDAWLSTAVEFGCVLWERKEEP